MSDTGALAIAKAIEHLATNMMLISSGVLLVALAIMTFRWRK